MSNENLSGSNNEDQSTISSERANEERNKQINALLNYKNASLDKVKEMYNKQIKVQSKNIIRNKYENVYE